MGVFMHPLIPCQTSNRWHWPHSTHLAADTLDELHRFAKRLGLKRSWFQDHVRFPHYDLNGSKFEMAKRLGAELIDPGEFMVRIGKATSMAMPELEREGAQ